MLSEEVKSALANADAGYWELSNEDFRKQGEHDISILAEHVRKLEKENDALRSGYLDIQDEYATLEDRLASAEKSIDDALVRGKLSILYRHLEKYPKEEA